MKELIPFVKEINLEDKISAITSISLEHQEKFSDGEIEGEFIIFGDYKKHADTTEKEIFKYRLPFTTIIPDEIDSNTVRIDIEDFTYDILDETIMKINIDYTITGEKKPIPEVREPEIIETKEERIPKIIEEYIQENNSPSDEDKKENEEIQNNDYITYYIHIVNEGETIEDIINKYNTNIDNLKIYNDITNINIGDKIIIPER